MIWPLFKSFLLFFLVLLPLPFLAPAPVSAKAPFHSSSAVTVRGQVLQHFLKQRLRPSDLFLLSKKGWRQVGHLHHCGNESEVKTAFAHSTWLPFEKPKIWYCSFYRIWPPQHKRQQPTFTSRLLPYRCVSWTVSHLCDTALPCPLASTVHCKCWHNP